MRFLKRRIKDIKLLNLIWSFLRAGVMEKKLFRDTLCGAPQGGILSPLLANVYLHALDQYMEQYTTLTQYQRKRRRVQGQANFLYVRYCDDSARRKPLDLGDERSPPGDSPDAPQ
jgi:RNA-directed DNA polymerase